MVTPGATDGTGPSDAEARAAAELFRMSITGQSDAEMAIKASRQTVLAERECVV